MSGNRFGELLEGTLGVQVLVTTVLFLSFGIMKTRKQWRVPPIPGLLTRSRPGGRSAVFTAREDAGSWSRPQAHREQALPDRHDTPDEEPQPEEKARHLGIRRFRVPRTYRTTRSDDLQTGPAARRRDPSAPPAA